MGFFDEYDSRRSLQVYAVGSPVFKIDFHKSVCFGMACISKEEFVREYISQALYSDVMNDILSQKPLKIESNITRTDTGFTQEALNSSYNILYKVDGKDIYFFESLGGFKFHLRFLD